MSENFKLSLGFLLVFVACMWFMCCLMPNFNVMQNTRIHCGQVNDEVVCISK